MARGKSSAAVWEQDCCFLAPLSGTKHDIHFALTLRPKPHPSQNPIVEISPDPTLRQSEIEGPFRAQLACVRRAMYLWKLCFIEKGLAPVVTCTGSNFSF